MTEQQAEVTTKGKTIFRVDKNKDNPFVMIDRRPIENAVLSWRAKGVLTYLVSRPDNWIVRLGDLVKRSPDGVYTVRAALKELTKAGHITRREERDETGRFKQYVLEVHEIPITLPLTNLPLAVSPHAVDLTLNNTDSLNDTDSTDTGAGAPLPLDWQIAMGAKTIQPLSEEELFKAKVRDAANLIDFQCPGAGLLAEAFMLARRLVIPQSKVKGNRKAAREMMDQGVRAEHITQATQFLLEKKLTVTDLFSVSKTAIALANPAPKVSDFPTPTGTYATAEEVEAMFRSQGLIP